MGSGYGIRCKTCDYKFSVTIGHGMLECGFLENDYATDKAMFYNRIYDEKVIADIEKLKLAYGKSLNECGCVDENEWRGHGRSPYLCPNCSTMHTCYYFMLKYPGGKYEPRYACPVCGSNLIRIKIKIQGHEDVDIDLYTWSKADNDTIMSLVDAYGEPVTWRCPCCNGSQIIYDNDAGCFDFD